MSLPHSMNKLIIQSKTMSSSSNSEEPGSIQQWKILFILAITMSECFIGCVSAPPDEPIKCSSPNNSDCTITNTYGAFPDRSVCHAANAVYPTSERELVSTVANATLHKQKMKVATQTGHSAPKLVCPDGQDGLLISTKYLNRVLEVNKSRMTVTVEPGVLLRDLISEAAKAGLALPYTPYWWGLTVGGLISTGAHGSTLWDKGSAVHDYVHQLRIVTPASPEQGYAIVRTLKDGDTELDAARVSLGVLGVISQVTFRMQPMFKRSIRYVTKSDVDFGDHVGEFGRQHEFADVQWFPSQRQVVYRLDDRVSSDVSGNGILDQFSSRPSATLTYLRSIEENEQAHGDANGLCGRGKYTTSLLEASAYGLTNNDTLFTGYPVIGYQNDLQASGSCLSNPQDEKMCAWDQRVMKGPFFYQCGFSIDLSVVSDFIKDVQRLVDLVPNGLCGLEVYSGILMRYVTRSNAYLGKQGDAIDFDITYYRSKDPKTPRLDQDITEEIEQMAVFKYGALPHWGKNRNVAFEGVIDKYENAGEFLKVKDKYDPLGLFSNEWTDQVLGLKEGGVTIVKEGCALEGLCVCSEDIHCAPNKGYFCQPGKVYMAARVCTPSRDLEMANSKHSEL